MFADDTQFLSFCVDLEGNPVVEIQYKRVLAN